jgi:hypothetical protein
MRDIYSVTEDVLAWLGPAAEGIDPDDRLRIYTDIASRPYWTRVWIIQEFVLGKKVRLQRGHVQHDWDDFDHEFPGDVRQDVKHMYWLFELKKRYKAQIRGLSLAEAIKFALGSEATDSRDRVYGVLGLVPRNSRSFIRAAGTAAYTLSPCQVYHRAFCYILPTRSMRLLESGVYPDSALKNNCKTPQCDGQKCGSLNKLIGIC